MANIGFNFGRREISKIIDPESLNFFSIQKVSFGNLKDLGPPKSCDMPTIFQVGVQVLNPSADSSAYTR